MDETLALHEGLVEGCNLLQDVLPAAGQFVQGGQVTLQSLFLLFHVGDLHVFRCRTQADHCHHASQLILEALRKDALVLQLLVGVELSQ